MLQLKTKCLKKYFIIKSGKLKNPWRERREKLIIDRGKGSFLFSNAFLKQCKGKAWIKQEFIKASINSNRIL